MSLIQQNCAILLAQEKKKEADMTSRIRPNATVEWDYGNDGRDGYYYIRFTCSKCGSRVYESEGDVDICPACGTELDWSKHATIKVIREVEWVRKRR